MKNPAQMTLDFEAPRVLVHPGKLNVHAVLMDIARRTSIPLDYRYFGRNTYKAAWACACGKTMVGVLGGDK